MIRPILINNATSVCDLTHLTLHQLIQVLAADVPLHWDRAGDVRLIPRHVVSNAYDSFRDTLAIATLTNTGFVSLAVARVKWEQTTPLADLHLSCDPLPRSGSSNANSGRVDAPA